jgi:FkbM family methyltransferase
MTKTPLIHPFRCLFDGLFGRVLPRSVYLLWRIRLRSMFDHRDELVFMRRVLKKGMIVVDIGANVGDYAVPASLLVGATGLVHAFEPVPATYELLQLRTGKRGNVLLHNLALGDRQGPQEMCVPKTAAAASLAEPGAHGLKNGGCDRMTVATDTLDDALRDLPRLDLVKCDVEGHEEAVFRGAARTLAAHSPIVVVEILQEKWPEGQVTEDSTYKLLVQQGFGAYQFYDGRLHPEGRFAAGKQDFIFVPPGRAAVVAKLLQ